MSLATFVPVACPYCGEPAEIAIDEAGGGSQSFIQDCPVCCQPWEVEVKRGRDGEWSAQLRTSDE